MIEGFFGILGAGKTYNMMNSAVKYLRDNKKCENFYTNMDSINVEFLRELTDFKGKIYYIMDWQGIMVAENGICLIDEMNIFMPSRAWSKMPGALMWKWAQVRKAHLDVWYTAHTPARVDKIIRELTFFQHNCVSWVGLKMFWMKTYLMGQFVCWKMTPFSMKFAQVYDSYKHVEIPEYYKKGWSSDQRMDPEKYLIEL